MSLAVGRLIKILQWPCEKALAVIYRSSQRDMKYVEIASSSTFICHERLL